MLSIHETVVRREDDVGLVQRTSRFDSHHDLSQQIIHVTDSSFEADVLKNSTPVLLDFWAEWCGPCKMIAPILDQIAAEYAGKVLVAKMNVDESPRTPTKYSVRSIPTLMLFKNGTVVDQKIGAVRKADVAAFLDNRL